MEIHGTVAPGFEGVRDAFARNFTEHGDVGASCSVYVGGAAKVDLWGGVADLASRRPWTRDTLALVYSATKGATAVLCHHLAERGELDLDAPVARYWPAFAANGKDAILVRMLLTHEAGLPAVDARLTLDQLLEGTPVIDALAAQAPAWPPGTAFGYHPLTYGWLLGEVVRRATGRSLGELFAERVAAPLGLDLHIGLPAAERARVAPLLDAPPPDPAMLDLIDDPELKALMLDAVGVLMDPTSLPARALTTNGVLPVPSAAHWNDPRLQSVELPGVNAITDARSLARMYAACLGEVDGVRLLRPETLAAAIEERASGLDRVTGLPSRFASGFMLLSSPYARMLSEASFGHSGVGGAMGFGDTESGVAFAYVQSQLANHPNGDPRTAGLLVALRAALREGAR